MILAGVAAQSGAGGAWGTYSERLIAVSTSLALIVAAITYAQNSRQNRRSQARLIYSHLTDEARFAAGDTLTPQPANVMRRVSAKLDFRSGLAGERVILATVVVHNGSDELIAPVKVQLVNAGLGTRFDTFSARCGAVEPNTDRTVQFVFPDTWHPNRPALGTTVIFRDSAGEWWRRDGADPIEHVHDDPENAKSTPTERAQSATNARLVLGKNPEPEPRVRIRVRFRRWLRERRGKLPIP